MNKNFLSFGVLAGILLLLLVLAGGAWWFFMGQYTAAAVPPASPVHVFLLSPTSGDDVAAGDFVLVDLQAVAPEAISWSEVFVDGASLGALAESPERASWTWQAWPAGIHVLSGRAQAADGQQGKSQTVIVNVIAVDEALQVRAEAGQTLAQVAAKFGVPPDQLAGANPKLDPSKPLSDGQPVNVPTGGTGQPAPDGGGGSGPGGGSPQFFINWELKLTGQVDKSYCYLSDGSGKWDKMPKPPFEFFWGVDNLYTQVFDATPPGDLKLQAQCWGWLGGVLKYLGQGETKSLTEGPLELSGDGFILVGLPQWPQGKEEQFTGGGPQVPPPYALREAKDAADCAAHAHPLLGSFICNTLLNAPVKQFIILEWEWTPGTPWTGDWINDIDGYQVFEILPDTEAPPKFLKTVTPLGAKATALPLPWGSYCYGVTAFVDDPQYGGKKVSTMATYCPGQPPVPQKIVLKPVQWMTTGGIWVEDGCDSYGSLDNFVDANNKTGFGNKPGQVMVGSLIVDDDDDDCFRQGDKAAAVKFDMPVLPPGAAVQSARLRFSAAVKQYSATAVATNFKLVCADGWGIAKQDWSGLINAIHYKEPNTLAWAAYNQPVGSLSPWDDSPEVEAKSQVAGWLKKPASNHGFILSPSEAPNPAADGYGECFTSYDNFELEINYFAP